MKVKCFGIAKEITKVKELELKLDDNSTVKQLKEYLLETYPEFSQFNSFMVAVNMTYASDDQAIFSKDEIAIIPPVSGG